MLEPGSTVTIWPRRGLGLAVVERGTVIREDDIGVVIRYRYRDRAQNSALPWLSISRVELHDDVGAQAA